MAGKIAFVIYDINVCGGTHKQLLKLVEYTEKQGQDFVIITKHLDLRKTYPGFSKYVNKFRIYKFPSFLRHRIIVRLSPIYNWFAFKWLLRQCKIVNIHDNNFEEIYPYLRNKKVFWQINDLHGAFRVGTNSSMPESKWAIETRNYIQKYSQSFEALTVNVGKNAQLVKHYLNRDAYVFYCGVEPIVIERRIEDSIDRFASKKIHLLSSGVFYPYRNYETQIEVVKSLRNLGYDVTLHIMGDTTRDQVYAAKIQHMIDDSHLREHIIIEGQVDEEQFAKLHKQADLFIFINIDQSWGLAVFEAQSCGLPVLVSKSVGATEILHDNVDSLFVDPKDVSQIVLKIDELIKNKKLYVQLSSCAAEFHKDWTWDKAYCSKMYDLMSLN